MRVLKWFIAVPAALLALAMLLMPMGGLVFLTALIVSGAILLFHVAVLGARGVSNPTVTFLQYAWKVYVGMAIFTLLVMITWSFQNCCTGTSTFRNHLLHYRGKHLESVLVAALWPYGIYSMDRSLQGWMSSWLEAALRAIEYWFYDAWRPTKFQTVDLREGTIKESTINPDTAPEVLGDFIAKATKERD